MMRSSEKGSGYGGRTGGHKQQQQQRGTTKVGVRFMSCCLLLVTVSLLFVYAITFHVFVFQHGTLEWNQSNNNNNTNKKKNSNDQNLKLVDEFKYGEKAENSSSTSGKKWYYSDWKKWRWTLDNWYRKKLLKN